MVVFKYHCAACFHEWEPGPTSACPRCRSTEVRAGASPMTTNMRKPDKGSNLHYLWIALAVMAIFLLFGFAGCSRLFFPPKRSRT